jgi:hypothetical protein
MRLHVVQTVQCMCPTRFIAGPFADQRV